MFTRFYYKALAVAQANSSYTGYSLSFKNYAGTTVTISSSLDYFISMCSYARINLCKAKKSGATLVSSGNYCVAFGDGDTPPTLDDYQLSGEHITTYDATITSQLDSDSLNSINTYTITNTGTSAFTIKEIGLFTSPSSSSRYFALVFREVLDSPVTIEAGGVGQVTLTLGVAIPT